MTIYLISLMLTGGSLGTIRSDTPIRRGTGALHRDLKGG